MRDSLLLGVVLLVTLVQWSAARQKTTDLSRLASRQDVSTGGTLQARGQKKAARPKSTCQQVCSAIWVTGPELVAASYENVLECRERLCKQESLTGRSFGSSIEATPRDMRLYVQAETDRAVKMLYEQCVAKGVSVQTLGQCWIFSTNLRDSLGQKHSAKIEVVVNLIG